MNPEKKAYSAITPALILIAFVLIATTFSVMLINVGSFIIHRSENIIRGSFGESSTLITTAGDIKIKTGNPANTSQQIMFSIRLIEGSRPVNIDPQHTAIAMSVSRGGATEEQEQGWSSPNLWQETTSIGKRVSVSVTGVIGSYSPDQDTLLEQNEIFQLSIIISPEEIAPKHNLQLTSHDTFEINVNLNIGPTLSLSRTLPGNIKGLVNLD